MSEVLPSPSVVRKLDETVSNRIAAGEVIQRPANALKELLENCLDARSTSIQITVKNGGLKFLQIQDNGTGIRKDDLEIVCERFTTSKLSSFEELSAITTFGFRGEALASISHVAHLTILTKTANDHCAYRASYVDGKLVGPVKCCAGNQGTQITVEDLFYNVPTRKRALSNSNDEHNKILDVVGKYAIHYPKTGFAVKKQGETSAEIKTNPNSTHVDNIRTIYGNNVARWIEHVETSDETLKFSMNAYITSVNYTGKKQIMLVFINNRLVECQPLRKAIEHVYSLYLPKGSYSFSYISLELEPRNVDVNIHPTKHQVHFLHEESIVEKIRVAIEGKLLSNNQSRVFYTQAKLPQALPGESRISVVQAKKQANISANYLVRTDFNDQKIDKFLSRSFENEKSLSRSNENENLSSRSMENEISLSRSNENENLSSRSMENDISLSRSNENKKSLMEVDDFLSEDSENDIFTERGNKENQTILSRSDKENDISLSRSDKENDVSLSRSEDQNEKSLSQSANEKEELLSPSSNIYETNSSRWRTNEKLLSRGDSEKENLSSRSDKVKEKLLSRGVNEKEKILFCDKSNDKNSSRSVASEKITLRDASSDNNRAQNSQSPRPYRREIKLSSVLSLRADVHASASPTLLEILREFVFVGVASATWSVVQHKTELYVCNHVKLLEEMFYQIMLLDFGNFGFVKFSNALPVSELINIALDSPDAGWNGGGEEKVEMCESASKIVCSRADMLLDYFSIEIDQEGNLLSVPLLLDDFAPNPNSLPSYMLRLATKVEWDNEVGCFKTLCRETARFYTSGGGNIEEELSSLPATDRSTWRWKLEHILFPAMKKNLIPTKKLFEERNVLQIASLPQLYKVFERC